MSYAKLADSGGVQWPCTAQFPGGKERLYEDGVFNTDADYCEVYGHDVVTGAALSAQEYAAMNPAGRAVIKGAEYVPPPEQPDDAYPMFLTTGRVTYHWHTRTKTARSPALNAAAPDAFVEIERKDAERLGIEEGDLVDVRSRRGAIRVPARLTGIEPGVVFIPFHYGDAGDSDHRTAANELTITGWDPVSKQPHFKYAAVRLERAVAAEAASSRRPDTAATADGADRSTASGRHA
jgi:anaerobic selenocysteine-containing dehydrogenase